MTQKTCFIISPIGPDDSDIRKHANDFLELLVEPALMPFDFTIVRADKIARPSIITTDIVTLVQQADLCLVDLTLHNPNVFYECGRRHETGRPVIHLIRKGETLPFDVAGIRTIIYDLSDPRTTLASVKQVQDFIREFEKGSYGTAATAASLAGVADTLSRIERSLDRVLDGTRAFVKGRLTPQELLMSHPGEAFHKAIRAGDIESATKLLPRIKKFLGEKLYVEAVAVLATAGDEKCKEILINTSLVLANSQKYDSLKVCVAGLSDFYTTTASFDKGIAELTSLIYEISNDESHPKDVRAFVLNRLQMLRYQERRFGDALRDALKVIELAPEDDSYAYNLSMIYEAQENFAEAAKWCDRFLELKTHPKSHHLEHVIGVYRKAGRTASIDALTTKYAQVPSGGDKDDD